MRGDIPRLRLRCSRLVGCRVLLESDYLLNWNCVTSSCLALAMLGFAPSHAPRQMIPGAARLHRSRVQHAIFRTKPNGKFETSMRFHKKSTILSSSTILFLSFPRPLTSRLQRSRVLHAILRTEPNGKSETSMRFQFPERLKVPSSSTTIPTSLPPL